MTGQPQAAPRGPTGVVMSLRALLATFLCLSLVGGVAYAQPKAKAPKKPRRVYIVDRLAPGATIIQPIGPAGWSPLYGMLKDRFGVTWVVDLEVMHCPLDAQRGCCAIHVGQQHAEQ